MILTIVNMYLSVSSLLSTVCWTAMEKLVFGHLVAASVDGVIVNVYILTIFIPRSESDE